ncbi:hypothetical protein DPX16_22906 [Anabarilius grahami]|uniref:Uncharacterized protein n=1 Tax=Anabarilius grahami TaxID=495550 RepID=A0A3N0XMD3_ANAGA|nr:hypothetical protein DPX16_22906 [Anabarilius grahami]
MFSPSPAVLRVILQDHDVRKLFLPSGIPNTVDDLLTIVKETFQLDEHFSLMYMDTDFGQFFTLTSTDDIKNKDSIKIIKKEDPSVILTLTPVCDSDMLLPARDVDQHSTDDQSSFSSRKTMLSAPSEGRSEKVLQAGNQAYFEDGTLLQNHSVKSDILQKLAESKFKYTAYPTNPQIQSVIEALIEMYPCLKEPGCCSGIRHEVVNLNPPIKDFQERWPALFTEAQIKDEFQRNTAVPLEQTFMYKLDGYTPKLLELLKAKGGVAGVKIKSKLSALNQGHTIEKRRDVVIRSLIEYLGEVEENLFKDCNDGNQEDFVEEVMVILVHANGDGEPGISIVLEGTKVLTKCENTGKACALLMGLIYSLNLQYPSTLKYTFEVFQKRMDLDGLKLSPKVRSLKNMLLM